MKLNKIPRSIKFIHSFEVVGNKKTKIIKFPSGVLSKTKNWNIVLSREQFDLRDKVFLITASYKIFKKVFYIGLLNNNLITMSEDEIDYFIKPHIRSKK